MGGVLLTVCHGNSSHTRHDVIGRSTGRKTSRQHEGIARITALKAQIHTGQQSRFGCCHPFAGCLQSHLTHPHLLTLLVSKIVKCRECHRLHSLVLCIYRHKTRLSGHQSDSQSRINHKFVHEIKIDVLLFIIFSSNR